MGRPGMVSFKMSKTFLEDWSARINQSTHGLIVMGQHGIRAGGSNERGQQDWPRH